jgi:hypothetical protein
MFLSIGATIFATTFLAVADRVPTFNVEPICRDVASRAAPIGTMDTCMKTEEAARAQLMREWSQFAPADKSHCLQLSTLGGEPTYTELLTCLELDTEARNAMEKDERAMRARRNTISE